VQLADGLGGAGLGVRVVWPAPARSI
jgi:hypothetical protein